MGKALESLVIELYENFQCVLDTCYMQLPLLALELIFAGFDLTISIDQQMSLQPAASQSVNQSACPQTHISSDRMAKVVVDACGGG